MAVLQMNGWRTVEGREQEFEGCESLVVLGRKMVELSGLDA